MSLICFVITRRERGGARKILEVEMDSVVEEDSSGVPEEQTPLTLNHDGHGECICDIQLLYLF